MSKSIEINPLHLQIVLHILKNNLPENACVWVFGSRAEQTKKPFSDFDLAIDATLALPYLTLVELKNEFEESDLPYKVDIVDWHLIDKDFQARIGVYRQQTQLKF